MPIGSFLGGLFGKTKQKPIYATEAGQVGTDEAINRLRDFSSATRPGAIMDFSKALKLATPEAERVSGERSQFYRNLIDQSPNYNPFEALYRPVGDYLFGKASEIAPAALDLTRQADVQNRINLGLAPGAGSSVADRARMSAVGRILSENFGRVLPAIESGARFLGGERAGERATALGALDLLAAEPDRLTTRALLPMQVESAGMAEDIANLGALINAAANNLQGFQSQPNIWARLGDAERASLDSLGQLAGIFGSVAGSMFGLPSMGGMMGGRMPSGGVGYPSTQSGAFLPNYWQNMFARNYPTTGGVGIPLSGF